MRSPLTAAAAILVLAGCGSERAAAPPPAAAPAGEDDVTQHFTRAAGRRAKPRRDRFTTARVVRRTTLRGSPGGRVLARIGRRTEFGSPRVLSVTGRRDAWLRVTASERANGEHGWIRASAARLGTTDIWIRVDRSRRELTLRRDRPCAAAAARRRRPARHRDAARPLRGHRPPAHRKLRLARTAAARSRSQGTRRSCCPAGPAATGSPSTPRRIPRRSATRPRLGCMRAYDRDIRVLMRRVPLGAPVVVVA